MNELTTFFTKIAFSILTALIITSCGGGDDKGVPPSDKKPDPTTPPVTTTPPLVGTVISGVVMIGPVINADVTVSELSLDKSNTPIKLITTVLNTTSQQTNDKGEYALSIKAVADNTPILVCATGGAYTEPASAALITPVEKTFQSQAQLCPKDLLCDEEKLCAVAIVKRDEKLKVNLTYFSHLSYGLAKSRLLKGATLLDVTRNNSDGSTSLVLGGISNANKIVSDWLQLTTATSVNKGVISVTPQDITITPVTTGKAILTDELKYGLANAAISDLVEWMRLTSSTTQTGPAFDKVSTIALAQQAFIDITDGDLDGKQNATSLFLSDTAIIGHMLRYHFAFKLFVVASNRRINQTGLNNADIDGFVKALNKNGVLFPSTPQVAIVNDKPVLSHVYPNNNDIINGDVSIKIDATDISDISSITMTIDTVPPGGNPLLPTNVPAANPEKPEWSITTVSEVTPATPGIPDGIYDIKFVATNTKGATTTRLMPNIRISNKDIHLHIVNPPVVSNTVGPKNPVNSLTGFTAIVNDVFFPENSNNSSVSFSIVSTDPQSTLTPITVPLKAPPFNAISAISRRYFASDLSNANPVIVPNGKYKLMVDATSGKNITPLLTASENVEFEYDTRAPSARFATQDFTVFAAASGLVTVNLNVNDQPKDGYMSGIKSTFLSHDALGGGEIPVTVNNNQSVFSFTEQGWHKLTLNAMDYAGNAAKTQSLNVAYDTKVPNVNILNKDSVRMIWQSKLDITAQVDDNESGISEIFSDLILSSNTTAAPTTNHYTGDITNAPNIKTNIAFTDKDLQLDNNGTPIVDGIYRYAISASDFTGVSSHTVISEVRNIGIDATPPLITFTTENILNTAFSATPVWNDVTGNAAISFDPANTTATMNWSFNATVEERNYIAHSTPTSIAGLSSGIAAVTVDGSTENVLSSDAAIYSINNKAKSVTVTNLPQYTIESTAAVTEVWNVIATCPKALTAGGTISLDATGKKCVELVAAAKQPRATVYNWVQISSTVDLPAPVAVAVPATAIISNNNPIVITAMDKSLVPNKPGLSGNQSKSFACLNFRVSNVTVSPQVAPSQIVIDSGVAAKLPTAGITTQDPTAAPIVCNEATTNSTLPPWNKTPLIPVLDSINAPAGGFPNTTAVTCTINATSKGTTIPAATTSAYKIEMQLSPQKSVDPASTKPLTCPAVI